MSNMTLNSSVSQLLCPQLQMMKDDVFNNNTSINMVVVCIHGLVSCLGILENALIMWVVGFRLRHRTVASVWVLNLALSDFLATLTLPLFTSYLAFRHSWELGSALCKAQTSVFFLNMFVSAFLLAAISIDRLLLVMKPVWSQNHRSVAGAWKVCAVGWLWAAVNTLPYCMFRSVTDKMDGRKLCYHNFALHLSSEAALERTCNVRQTSTAISKFLLAFLFPLMVIAGSYIKIGFNLKKRNSRRKQSAGRLADPFVTPNRNGESVSATARTPTKTINIFLRPLTSRMPLTPKEKRLSPTASAQTNQSQLSQSFTRMVTSVIAAFALCWAPYHIFCIIEVSAQYNKGNLKLVEVGLPLATTIAFLNPVLNPILYAFSCPHFCVRIRQSLGAVFDGLVEERGGLLMAPGKNLKAHIFRKNSRDVGLAMPGSPKASCLASPSSEVPPTFPSPFPPSEEKVSPCKELESTDELD